ncbi:MAG: hypothetical protein WA822_06840 [Albidovulum sp.]
MRTLVGFPRQWPAGAVPFRNALILFWAIDLSLLAAYVGGRVLVFLGQIDAVPDMLGIAKEYSLPEGFNYLKWALCLTCMLVIFFKSRVALFACLAVLFAMILADDSLLIHENYGLEISDALGFEPMINLTAKQLGELAVFGIMGTIAMILIFIGYWQSPREFWPFAHRYLLVIFALAIVGVALDAVHAIFWDLTSGRFRNIVTLVMNLLEDGGEMIFASLGVAYSWGALKAIEAKGSARA